MLYNFTMLKNRKKTAILFVYISILILAIAGCTKSQEPSYTPDVGFTSAPTQAISEDPTPTATAAPQPIEIVLGGTGDIMVHKKQLTDARYTASFNDGYDYYFEHNFKYIKSALEYPDLMFGNLETVFGGAAAGEYIGFPKFNTPDELAPALKNAGFDVLTNSNNHSLDQGKEGLLRTLSILDENGFYHTGTFSSIESYNTPLIIEVKGVKIGVLSSAYAYQNRGTLTDEEQSYMISQSSEEYLKAEVADLKNAGAQIIVASMHWGYENHYEIYDDQKELAPILIKAGVDVIFGHHPHILQPIEYMEVELDDGTVNSAVVCWSLGNFLANSPMRLEQQGAICYVYLSFDPVTETVTIQKAQVLPTYIFYTRSYLYDFHVLPSGTLLDDMNIDDFEVPSGFEEKLKSKFYDVAGSITDSYVEFIGQVPEN
ncbi:MAG: CapA family protein [Eubacteriales bacterium]